MKRTAIALVLWLIGGSALFAQTQAAPQAPSAQSQAPAAQTNDWQQIASRVPPLPAFKPPIPKRIALPNGMMVFLQEDHELPLVDGIVRIRGGARDEPAGKTGLVDLYGEVWRTGGTKTQTGDQMDDFLEIRAAKVETGGGADSTTIGWSCLKPDFDDVFKVLVDLLRNPEFRPDKLEIAQQGAFDAISRRNDDIAGIARREAAKREKRRRPRRAPWFQAGASAPRRQRRTGERSRLRA